MADTKIKSCPRYHRISSNLPTLFSAANSFASLMTPPGIAG
jgi:hypothetical protein